MCPSLLPGHRCVLRTPEPNRKPINPLPLIPAILKNVGFGSTRNEIFSGQCLRIASATPKKLPSAIKLLIYDVWGERERDKEKKREREREREGRGTSLFASVRGATTFSLKTRRLPMVMRSTRCSYPFSYHVGDQEDGYQTTGILIEPFPFTSVFKCVSCHLDPKPPPPGRILMNSSAVYAYLALTSPWTGVHSLRQMLSSRLQSRNNILSLLNCISWILRPS